MVSNQIKFMRTSQHGHQSNYQAPGKLRVEGDIERRIQALIAKDGIRIREFFLDFDKLRKGTVGEAHVSICEIELENRNLHICFVGYSLELPLEP